MANPQDNAAWFESQAVQVDDFEVEDCPHGQLFKTIGDNEFEYGCTRCGELFHAHAVN